jgi:hypothetical protein
MTAFTTDARHTTDFPCKEEHHMVGVFKRARVFSLFSLMVLFMLLPPWAAIRGNENHAQAEAHITSGASGSLTLHTSQVARKSREPLVNKSADQPVEPNPVEESSWIRSVSVPNIFSYDVVQQPESDPYYVSSSSDLVTEFGLAKKYGTIGLVAHNNLAGTLFTNLDLGQEIQIVYTDGHTDRYTVSAIYRFRALQPANTESQFVDLASEEVFTANELFERMYTGSPHVTFQTCIYGDGNPSWGRFFAVATPVAGTQ